MRTSALSRFTLAISVATAWLSGCGTLPLSQPALSPSTRLGVGRAQISGFGTVFSLSASGKESVLHSFGGGSSDGANPYAGLLNVDGTLYGTTQSGGTYDGGTVFAITPSGAETILHSFGGSGDGTDPMAALIDVDGTLYGTTHNGGIVSSACEDGCGVVFSITPSGTETVLHSFEGYPVDGAYPAADLLNVNGTLYGTTGAGGSAPCKQRNSAGCGTVFTIAVSGGESVLFSFGTRHDDCCPSSGLVNVGGTLYGTTSIHSGKVFKISTSGDEASIHKFKGYPNDGAKPNGDLIEVGGTLYGTTRHGGASQRGTVFAITTSGTESELYSFAGGAHGGHPQASLLDVNGTLYGTVSEGGVAGHGAVFAITSGAESVIYSFRGYPNDGASPHAGLVNVKGTLYGTTEYGGANQDARGAMRASVRKSKAL